MLRAQAEILTRRASILRLSITLAAVAALRPDVVLVDALLQGRVKGPALVEQIAASGAPVPAAWLTTSTLSCNAN